MIVCYDLDELQKSPRLFFEVTEDLRVYINDNFSKRNNECTIVLNGEVFETKLNFVLINLILLSFFVNSNIKIMKCDLYTHKIFNAKLNEQYANHCLERFTRVSKDYGLFKRNLQKMNDSLNRCSNYSAKYGITFSLYDFIKLLATNEEAKSIFKPVIPENLTYEEVEELEYEYADKAMNLIKNDPTLDLYDFAIAETGINKKQFRQFATFVGLKPDMYNGIIPKVVTDNFLFGLRSKEFYYINCIGTRKAMCINYANVRKSGYVTRTLDMAMVDCEHDPDLHDCGTKHLVKYNIENFKRLEQINKRHFKLIDDETGALLPELYTIDINDEVCKSLIGKTIALRSPITCAGDKICATCYGRELSEKNRYVHAGINANKNVMEPIMQLLLSAKHFLSTDSISIDFPLELKTAFDINLDKICFNDNTEYSVTFDTPTVDDLDEDTDCYIIRNITINDLENKTSTKLELSIDFLLNPDIVINMNKETNTISKKDCDDYIFRYIVKNNELTKALENIIGLFESSSHLGISDYNELINKFCELAIENNLSRINSVHAEMLISALIVDPITLERVNFSKTRLPEYIISRASATTMNGPITRALSYERIPQQLADLRTYEKTKKSNMDYLFK